MSIKDFFSFKWLTSFVDGPKAQKIVEDIETVAHVAIPVIEYIAKLTPNKADDEIAAVLKQYGVAEAEKFLALPAEHRGMALLAAATTGVQKLLPHIPVSSIQTGIQIALAGFKSK
jgi:hypothetical protein